MEGTVRRIVERAKAQPRRVVFPEPEDPRVLRAASRLSAERIVEPVLLGEVTGIICSTACFANARRRFEEFRLRHEVDLRNEKLAESYDRLAELSLDKEWDKRSPKDLEKFVSLLRALVERQYQRNMESTLDYKVKWVGSEPIDEGVKVKSSARSVTKKRQPPITIDYSMSPASDEWKVFDILTDDVSLVKNYKRQKQSRMAC